jgi:hypothetical protein
MNSTTRKWSVEYDGSLVLGTVIVCQPSADLPREAIAELAQAATDRPQLEARCRELEAALHTLCCAADSVCDKRAGAVADLSEAAAQVRRVLVKGGVA